MYKYRKAVLIIHGFAGGTYDEESLFFTLQPRLEFDVYNFTLPGHKINLSTDVKYEEWIKCVSDKVEYLKNSGYTSIYLIGHSMGGLLATICANKYPIVKRLVLVAPAFKFLSSNDDNTIVKAIKTGPDIIKTYQVKEVISRFLKVSVQQFKEFEKVVSISQEEPKKLRIPTLIIQGTSDQVVPYESSEEIFNKMNCNKWLIELDGVTHDVFEGIKVDKINQEICKFLKKKNYNEEKIRKW